MICENDFCNSAFIFIQLVEVCYSLKHVLYSFVCHPCTNELNTILINVKMKLLNVECKKNAKRETLSFNYLGTSIET